jgi:hypothetical protein
LGSGRSLADAPFDRGYRVDAITRYLFGTAGDGPDPDPDLVRSLFLDKSLAPYLRLAFLRGPNYFQDDAEELLPVARQAAEEIGAGAPPSATFASELEDLTALLERLAEQLKTPRKERMREALRSLR